MRRAMLQAATLSDWLTGQLDRDKTLEPRAELASAAQQAVHALIGLGPGLTPSGDDLISGMMIALHASSETTVARALANFVRTAPPDATNALSRAFLAAAAEGYPSAALHHAIAALLTGDALALPAAVDRLGRVGHTSGWDMLAGTVLALSAVAEARLRSPPNPRS